LDRLLDTRKWIAVTGSVVIIAMLATLALSSRPPLWVPVGAILSIGFFSASGTMVMTHARGIFPDRLIGRGMATINTAVMLGVACMQTLSGIVVGIFEPLASGARTETAYRALFAMLSLVLIVAVAFYGRSRDIKPSDQMRDSLQGRDG
jgi:nitrate/nitrite transporter NarK